MGGGGGGGVATRRRLRATMKYRRGDVA